VLASTCARAEWWCGSKAAACLSAAAAACVLVITKWRRALEWVGSSAATAAVELGLCVSDGEGCLFL
jgi:hypothetical protein